MSLQQKLIDAQWALVRTIEQMPIDDAATRCAVHCIAPRVDDREPAWYCLPCATDELARLSAAPVELDTSPLIADEEADVCDHCGNVRDLSPQHPTCPTCDTIAAVDAE